MAISIANIPSLKQKLAYLAAEERALSEQINLEEATLLKQISEREDALKRLRSEHQHHQQRDRGTDPPAIPEITTTSDHLRQHPPQQRPGFPLDSLIGQAIHRTASPLNQSPVGHSSQPRSLAEVYREQEMRSSEIFLRPSQATDVGQGKPLSVVDFVSRLRPQEDEQVVTTDSGAQTKLVLSFGNKKPKLAAITHEQFSIANLRIFYELLTSNRLPTAADLRDYLSDSIKVFELARKYTWESVKYHDEYRILQHTYGYPWSFDNSHLHEVILIPRWAVTPARAISSGVGSGSSSTFKSTSSGTSSTTFFGTHTSGGVEICRNYNRPKGCVKRDCRFSHVCNRKTTGGRVCEKLHAGHSHNSVSAED